MTTGHIQMIKPDGHCKVSEGGCVELLELRRTLELTITEGLAGKTDKGWMDDVVKSIETKIDKVESKVSSVNGKLWAVLVTLFFNLFAVAAGIGVWAFQKLWP